MICQLCKNHKSLAALQSGQVDVPGTENPCSACFRLPGGTGWRGCWCEDRISLIDSAKKIKVVYIAGKLNDMAVDYIRNVHLMMVEAEFVRKLGFSVYIPGIDMLCGVKFGDYKYEDYFNNSQPILDVCHAVYVCSGWESSEGTRREIARANKNGQPVFYSREEISLLKRDEVKNG